MNRAHFASKVAEVFQGGVALRENFAVRADSVDDARQDQTNAAFSEKWTKYENSDEKDKLFDFQRNWYLTLYGFESEAALAHHLRASAVIFDAGCGMGYKAAWFAGLAPHAVVIGMDFSEAAAQAARRYAALENLFFIQGDIADTGLASGIADYVSCDQVIMHTQSPERTFAELVRVTSSTGQVACYFYAKKAVPRELLDDYFRTRCTQIDRSRLWAMSEQLAELGRRLSDLKVQIDVPEIPELRIKAGRYDIQRFIYWSFLKCFWNEDLGRETSVLTNFDWYSPSNARRFSEEEVRAIVADNGMTDVFFHAEEACYSGRFMRRG
jgi:SAM-dependent methyltransferase